MIGKQNFQLRSVLCPVFMKSVVRQASFSFHNSQKFPEFLSVLVLNNQNEDEAAFISHVKYYKKCKNGHGFGVITMEMRHLHFMSLQIEVRQANTDLKWKKW